MAKKIKHDKELVDFLLDEYLYNGRDDLKGIVSVKENMDFESNEKKNKIEIEAEWIPGIIYLLPSVQVVYGSFLKAIVVAFLGFHLTVYAIKNQVEPFGGWWDID